MVHSVVSPRRWFWFPFEFGPAQDFIFMPPQPGSGLCHAHEGSKSTTRFLSSWFVIPFVRNAILIKCIWPNIKAEIAFFASSPRCGADGHRLADWKLLLRRWCRRAHLRVHQRRRHLRHLAGLGALQPQRHCTGPNHGVSVFSSRICQAFSPAQFGNFFSYYTWFLQRSRIHFEQENHQTVSRRTQILRDQSWISVVQ